MNKYFKNVVLANADWWYSEGIKKEDLKDTIKNWIRQNKKEIVKENKGKEILELKELYFSKLKRLNNN